MAVAFVISTPEEAVVRRLEGENTPRMDGSLFTFTRNQLPDFLDRMAEFCASVPLMSEEFRAAVRLQERLGTWIGKSVVAKDKTARKRKVAAVVEPEPEDHFAWLDAPVVTLLADQEAAD